LFRKSEASPFALKVVIMAISPLILSLLNLIVWKLGALLRPEKLERNYKRNATLTAFVFAYLSYPLINSYAFSAFNCREIEGKNYFT